MPSTEGAATSIVARALVFGEEPMSRWCLCICALGLMLGSGPAPVFGAADYTLHSPGLTVELSQDGKVTGVILGNKKVRWTVLGVRRR